jgi:hypothetical protein
MTPELFIKSIERAAKYRIEDIPTIKRIAVLSMQSGSATLPAAEVDEDLDRREAYQEGFLTESPDLSLYQDQDQEPGNPDQNLGPGPDQDPGLPRKEPEPEPEPDPPSS